LHRGPETLEPPATVYIVASPPSPGEPKITQPTSGLRATGDDTRAGWSPALAPWGWTAQGVRGGIWLFVLTGAAYAAGSELALALLEASGLSAVFFIPAGITFGILLRVPSRRWWVVLLAAGLAEAVMDLAAGYPLGQSAGYVAANVAEPLVGAALVTKGVSHLDLTRLRHLWWFFLGGVMAGPATGAAIGSLTALLTGDTRFFEVFWQWWLGDALGVILVGGAILVWRSSSDRRSLASAWGVVLLGGTSLLTIAVLAQAELPLLFLVLIGVALAGTVFGVRAVAVTALLISAVVAVGLATGFGRLIPGLPDPSALVVVKLQLGVFTLAGLVVAAEANERELASRRAAESDARAKLAERARTMEHEVALRLQTALLPDDLLHHPMFEIDATYRAGSEALVVGGDWYDVLELPDGRIGVTVGDVVGHGLEATAAMGRLRTAAAALAPHAAGPGELLTHLDAFVRGPNGSPYATAAYGILDPGTGRLVYASAGHPPMLLVGPHGTTTWLTEGRSPPFCAAVTGRRSEASTVMVPGSVLIAYSDGLIERRNEDLRVGLERLEREAVRLAGHPTAQICDLLVAHLGVATSRTDDVVVVALRYDPAVESPPKQAGLRS
jgi:serine phosphatase RsbU (regulator of sigma subunit)